MNPLISEALVSIMENQMGHEMKNALIYLFISGVFDGKGLNKLAGMFKEQYKEELGHFEKIQSFLTDLNVVPKIVEVDSIDSVSLGLQDDINSIAGKFMEREVLTTENLGEILDVATEEENRVAVEFIREMIEKQQHEYAEATEFADKASLCGNNWMNVLIWNNTI